MDYLDRVEERGIETLSVSKIRERILERIPMEKHRLIKFAKECVEVVYCTDNDIKTLFEETFLPVNEKIDINKD